MKLIPRYFIILCLLLSGCLPVPSTPRMEPNAGQWHTWVVTDVSTVRLPAPPDQSTPLAELKELQAAAVRRNEATLQQIAYCASGALSYRWLEIAFAQNRAKPASGPHMIRMMSLLNGAIYDAMVAAWDGVIPTGPGYWTGDKTGWLSVGLTMTIFGLPDEKGNLNCRHCANRPRMEN